jgi:hypothetical protein
VSEISAHSRQTPRLCSFPNSAPPERKPAHCDALPPATDAAERSPTHVEAPPTWVGTWVKPPADAPNLALIFVAPGPTWHGSIVRSLDEWEGDCLELADCVLKATGADCVLYVELRDYPSRWKYHAVPVVAGIVHDAWHPEAMLPPAEYVARVFPGAPWELIGGAEDDSSTTEGGHP